MAFVLMDPQSKLDFAHDWDGWIAEGDSIATRQWAISPTEGSPEAPLLEGATSETVRVSGLTAGQVYRLTEHIVTTAGIEDDQTIIIRCDST